MFLRFYTGTVCDSAGLQHIVILTVTTQVRQTDYIKLVLFRLTIIVGTVWSLWTWTGYVAHTMMFHRTYF